MGLAYLRALKYFWDLPGITPITRNLSIQDAGTIDMIFSPSRTAGPALLDTRMAWNVIVGLFTTQVGSKHYENYEMDYLILYDKVEIGRLAIRSHVGTNPNLSIMSLSRRRTKKRETIDLNSGSLSPGGPHLASSGPHDLASNRTNTSSTATNTSLGDNEDQISINYVSLDDPNAIGMTHSEFLRLMATTFLTLFRHPADTPCINPNDPNSPFQSNQIRLMRNRRKGSEPTVPDYSRMAFKELEMPNTPSPATLSDLITGMLKAAASFAQSEPMRLYAQPSVVQIRRQSSEPFMIFSFWGEYEGRSVSKLYN